MGMPKRGLVSRASRETHLIPAKGHIKDFDDNYRQYFADDAAWLWDLERIPFLPPVSVDGGTQEKSVVLHMPSWN